MLKWEEDEHFLKSLGRTDAKADNLVGDNEANNMRTLKRFTGRPLSESMSWKSFHKRQAKTDLEPSSSSQLLFVMTRKRLLEDNHVYFGS